MTIKEDEYRFRVVLSGGEEVGRTDSLTSAQRLGKQFSESFDVITPEPLDESDAAERFRLLELD